MQPVSQCFLANCARERERTSRKGKGERKKRFYRITTWPDFPFTCHLLFILCKRIYQLHINISSIRITLHSFFYFENRQLETDVCLLLERPRWIKAMWCMLEASRPSARLILQSGIDIFFVIYTSEEGAFLLLSYNDKVKLRRYNLK